MQWRLVFLYVGETTDGFIETIVGGIVVALAYLANHNLAMPWLAIEAVIEVLFHADALTGTKDYTATRIHDVLYAIYAIVHGGLGKLLVLVGIVKFDDEVASTTIDDVFHLGPMEMHGSLLVLPYYHYLLGVWFLIDAVLPVADGEEEEAAAQEIARTEIGDVPAQHSLGDVADTIFVGLPVGQAPGCPLGQHELTGCQKLLGIADDLVNFASFHIEFCLRGYKGGRGAATESQHTGQGRTPGMHDRRCLRGGG